MAIFSRRIVQRMLDENANFTNAKTLDHQVSRLNAKGFQIIATEWELAVLNAFSSLGAVENEPKLQGTSKPDLLFTHADGSQLLADIVTVSDEGWEARTGVKAFEVALKDRLEKEGLLFKGWSLAVGTHPTTKYRQQGMPALPARSEFGKEIFNANFDTFISLVKERPNEQRTYYVSTPDTAVALMYLPTYKYFMTQLPTNRPATSKEKNVVFNALKMKARQLRKARHNGVKAIILCDGGSQMVRSQPHGAFEFNFNAADAAKDFLRQNQSVDFVLLLASVLTSTSRFGPTKPPYRKVQVTLIPNQSFPLVPEAIRQTVTALENFFPEPENTSDGARETIRNKFDLKGPRPLAGGYLVSSTKIRISADAVVGLLAGLVKQDELFQTLNPIQYAFRHKLSQKMRIESVDVEQVDEADETYLVFR